MKIRIKNRPNEIILLAILFAFSISFLNLAGYIYVVLIGYVFVKYGRQIKMSSSILLLIGFSGTYFLFYACHFGISLEKIIIYLLGPWTAFIIGKMIVEKKLSFSKFIIILSSGMFLHGFLNWITYLRSSHYQTYDNYRRSVDVWRKELVNVNTTGMFFTFATGISIGVIFSNAKRIYKIFAAMIVLVSTMISMFFANRTLLVIVVLLIFWGLFVSRAKSSKELQRRVISIAIVTVLVAGAVYIIMGNVGGIGQWFGSLKIIERLTTESLSGRSHVWKIFLEDYNFLRYPWGGKYITEPSRFEYLHNMWLDIYNVAGIVPFIFFVFFCVLTLKRVWIYKKIMNLRNNNDEYNMVIFLLLAIILNCAVEPIIEANPYYFITALMFLGGMEGTIRNYKKSIYNNSGKNRMYE